MTQDRTIRQEIEENRLTIRVSAHVCSLFAVEGDASPLPEHRSAEHLMLRELKALRPETLMVSLLESIEQACPHGCPFCPDAGKVFFGCHRLLDTSYLRLYLVEASFHLPLCLTLLLCELAKAGGHVLGSVDRASMQQVPN